MRTGVVDWLAPSIRRILAPNPSPMTGPGTNTYIIGRGDGLVILDPGPESASHLAAVLSALGPSESVSALVVTHAHKDHTAGARPMAEAMRAPVLAFGDATSGRSALMTDLVAQGLSGGGEGADDSFSPDLLVKDGDSIPCGTSALQVIHTPGHMGGHICLGWDDVLFSGDHAMGWSSSLISAPDGDMRAYRQSLHRLASGPWRLMLPGHGAEVQNVAERLTALIDHRQKREDEILFALSRQPMTTKDLTTLIYHDTPPDLHPAAQRNVLAHLIDLWERNEIHCEDILNPKAIFERSEDR